MRVWSKKSCTEFDCEQNNTRHTERAAGKERQLLNVPRRGRGIEEVRVRTESEWEGESSNTWSKPHTCFAPFIMLALTMICPSYAHSAHALSKSLSLTMLTLSMFSLLRHYTLPHYDLAHCIPCLSATSSLLFSLCAYSYFVLWWRKSIFIL